MLVQPEPDAPFQVGEYVTIEDAPGALTWKILDIDPAGSANGPLYTLESGLTGRRCYVTADRLNHYRRIYG